MLTLRDYVNWGIAHSDNVGKAEGVPLVMEKCKTGKKMKQLEVYGESVQNGTPSPEAPVEVESVGELVTDIDNENYGKYKIPVTVRGKNLFNCSVAKSLYNGNVSGNSFEITVTGVAWTPHNASSFVHLDLGLASYYVGKTLVASFDVDVPTGELFNDSQFVLCDADGSNRTAISGTIVNGNEHYHIKSTLAESNYGEKHLTLRLYIRDATAYQKYEVKNIMVAESDTDIHFEPYIEPVTTNVYLNEPLRKIGEYADVIDFKGKKVVRKCVKKYLKDYKWSKLSINVDGGYTFVVHDTEILPNSSNFGNSLGIALSNVFLCFYGYPGTSLDTIHMWNWSSNVRVVIKKSRLDDEGITFEEWLNRHNPYMIRIRVTETEEPIICELPKLEAKTSIVEINTNLLPSNIKGKYIKR